MNQEFRSSLLRRFESLSVLAASAVLLAGSLVLIGWTFDLESLKRVLPGLTAMNPMTAVSFVLLGLSVWLLSAPQADERLRAVVPLLALTAVLIGALKLGEYFFDLNIPIDQLLFSDKLAANDGLRPNRMAPNTALSFFLVGTAVLLADQKEHRVLVAQLFTCTAMLVGVLALIGYVYGVREFYGVVTYIPMALHTAAAFVVLSIGMLFARADHGLMATVSSDSTGGVLARRALPAAILVPFVLGWLRLEGERLGLYGTEFGTTLLSVAIIVVLSAVVWWTARSLFHADIRRKQAELALQKLNESLEARVRERTAELSKINQELRSEIGHRERVEQELREAKSNLEQRVAERTTELRDAVDQLWTELGERQRAEGALRQSEEKFSKAFRASPAGITITSLNEGRFIDVNDSYLELLGYVREEVIGRTSLDIHLFADPSGRGQFLDELRARGMVRDLEMRLRTKSGEIRDALASLEQIELRGEPCILSIVHDVTERKRAEESIKQLNQELENRQAQLEAANKELEAFSYSVSHDLRAPLRSIDGFSLALVEDYGDTLNDNAKDYLNRIRAAAQRMGELIDGLLNLSRLTRAEMRRETVDLSLLARQVASELCQREPHRRVEFAIQEQLVAEGDERLLRAVLDNLFANAWKYTEKHPTTRIEFGADGQKDGKRVFYVKDDGAGFDMAYADKLFGAFQRLHRASEFKGTGIGLATVQRIIHRHGGRVWAEGAVEKGATFYFTL